MLYDRVDRQNQHQRQSHAKQSRNQTLDQCFGVEYPRDIVLRRADGAQNADLLCALQHGNICDNADHDRRDDQRDRDKRDQNIRNGVDDRRDRTHQQRNIVRIRDLVVLRQRAVVALNAVADGVLVRKRGGVQIDLRRLGAFYISERRKRVLKSRIRIRGGNICVIEILHLRVCQLRRVHRGGQLLGRKPGQLRRDCFGILRCNLLTQHLCNIIEQRLVVHLRDIPAHRLRVGAHLPGVGVRHLRFNCFTRHAVHGLLHSAVQILARRLL